MQFELLQTETAIYRSVAKGIKKIAVIHLKEYRCKLVSITVNTALKLIFPSVGTLISITIY